MQIDDKRLNAEGLRLLSQKYFLLPLNKKIVGGQRINAAYWYWIRAQNNIKLGISKTLFQSMKLL